MDKENTGCFAWIVSFKQSCTERWARFRNRLRRRFYARRGRTIDPSTIVNETGTKDMVISKTAVKKNKVLPDSLDAPKAIEKDCPVDAGNAQVTGVNEDFETLVAEYVSCAITRAADTLLMERQASLGNKNVIVENSADDVSLSPSIISHWNLNRRQAVWKGIMNAIGRIRVKKAKIAIRAVTESLSNVLLESNMNHSAIHKDIKEFMVQKSLELLTEKFLTDNFCPTIIIKREDTRLEDDILYIYMYFIIELYF